MMAQIQYLTEANYKKSKKNNWPVLVLDLSVGNAKRKSLGWATSICKKAKFSGSTTFPCLIKNLENICHFYSVKNNFVLLLEGSLSYCLSVENVPSQRKFEKKETSWHLRGGMNSASQAKVILDQIQLGFKTANIKIHVAELFRPTKKNKKDKYTDIEVAEEGLRYYLNKQKITALKNPPKKYYPFISSIDGKGHLVFHSEGISVFHFSKN